MASPSILIKPLSPIEQVRRHLLALKQHALDANPLPDPVAGSPLPFVAVTTPYVAYPAPNAAAVTLLSYTVPAGLNGVVVFLGIFNVGAAFVNGSGNVIWRVLINGAGVKGLNNLQSQFGTDALPLPVVIPLVENDTIIVTVEVPNGQPALPFPANSTGARIHGNAANTSVHSLVAAASGQGGGTPPPPTPAFGGGAGGRFFRPLQQ
ncbi:MAG: hypothetical protein LAP21_15145 [Acidobacteriia bacterium]|nr:hypothetical protein [Terriglobia bacterium]